MYGYEGLIELTPDQILQKITQQQIFEFVLKKQFDFNDRYLSPFREDKRPDCRFEQRPDGTIVFVDFGEKFLHPNKTHRSAFRMVMDKFNVTMHGAIRLLCKEFNLSICKSDYSEEGIVKYDRMEKSFMPMEYESKPFSRADIIHWSQFLIKPEHLLSDNSYAVRSFTVLKDGKLKQINIYQYCYVFDFVDRKKFYQPYSIKYRFITNCDENNIGNFDNLPPSGEELIIQKSYKDHRVLRNLEWGLNVIWFQSEGCVPEREILVNLTQRFKLITIFYDNDVDGIIAAMKLCDIFNSIRQGCCRMVHLPVFISRKLTWKDPGEFINKEGKQDLFTVLKQIGIYESGNGK
jgi:hypothetical protein